MEFRTIVDIEKPTFLIGPCEHILFIGSCFADNIGKRFEEDMFNTVINPFGVMYNPASILHSVEKYEGEAPQTAVFTLGTNHVYILKETGEIVDNCQKRPHNLFREEQLSVDECCEYMSAAIDNLISRNPEIRIIITVSPIRYAKYGFHGSQLSKAVLLLAADLLTRKYAGRVEYFPAYEIINDELRDYRFYNEDMLHPSAQAVEYIWERFAARYFSEDTHRFIAEWHPLKEAFAHRPFNPESSEYKDFITATRRKADIMAGKYPDMPRPWLERP